MPSLAEVGRFFLWLGCVGFGGPAAHVALMQREVVERRGWLTRAEFLDLWGATNLIPGPNSTEMAIHIGYRLAGWPGLLVAGTAFILPAFLMVLALAWAYQRFGYLPQVAGVLYAVKPVIIAVVVQAILALAGPATRGPGLKVLTAVVLGLAFLGVDELALLFGAGALWAAWRRPRGAWLAALLLLAAVAVGVAQRLPGATPSGPLPFGLAPLFLFFLKVGGLLYGSGYVLLAFLRNGLVLDWRWLTQAQLLDAVAVGQVTPGPVFTTATFVGYQLGGLPGAVVATVGIFLPSFVFVALSGPLLTRARDSELLRPFLDGVNAAALALMAFVTCELGRAALVDGRTLVLALLSAVLLGRWKVNSAWLILGAAVLGALVSP